MTLREDLWLRQKAQAVYRLNHTSCILGECRREEVERVPRKEQRQCGNTRNSEKHRFLVNKTLKSVRALPLIHTG